MHSSTIFFLVLLAVVAGIAAGSFFIISHPAVLTVAAVCGVLIAIFYRKDSKLLNPKIALVAFLGLFFVLGVVRFNTFFSSQRVLINLVEAGRQILDPENKHPIEVALYGYVDKEPQHNGSGQKLVFKVKEMETFNKRIAVSESTLITAERYPEYRYGQILKIYGQVKEPENFSDFDYSAFLAKDGVFSTLNFPEIETVAPSAFKVNGLSIWERAKLKIYGGIFVFKRAFLDSIRKSVSEPAAAFTEGILTGGRSGLSDDLKSQFSKTGTSHIMAVSGYNITIIAWLVSLFLLLFLKRQTAFWFSILAIFGFTVLTGAEASVVRAAIMGFLVLVARQEGRLSDPRNAIVLAGAVMVFLNPRILKYDVGFQLSFAATLGLIYAAPVLERYFSRVPNFFKLKESFVATASAQFFVLPVLLYHFQNLSLISIPANVLILPIVPIAMLAGFIGGVAGMILPFFGQMAGYFVWFFGSLVLLVVNLLSKPNWASVNVSLSWHGVIIYYVLAVILVRHLRNRKRPTKP